MMTKESLLVECTTLDIKLILTTIPHYIEMEPVIQMLGKRPTTWSNK
jgi:hypothetical protein